MIQVAPQMRILVAVAPADFRKGIDGLARLCRVELASDPFSGVLFVFRNRRRTALKVLVYDGQGFWLCQKRLSAGRFRFWPEGQAGSTARSLKGIELQLLLSGGDPSVARTATADWRRIHTPV
jgi:transposase